MTQVVSNANVQWIGNTYHWPADGQITAADHFWINTETYPIGSADEVQVVYSINGGSRTGVALSKNGTSGDNDCWHLDLGTLPSGALVQFALKAVGANVLWDNNHGHDFSARINMQAGEIGSTGLAWNEYLATISVVNPASSARGYVLTTNQPGRNDATRTNTNGGSVAISEHPGQPVIRTGNDVFDGLFALAYQEMRQLSGDGLVDGNYNNGEFMRCPEPGTGGCFQTGQRWTYAWTRDTAYAVELALAQLDPIRAMNTLLFKISPRRSAPTHLDAAEIVQDMGTGGSWPVSTDRVVWARGARELLKYLTGSERQAFALLAYAAMRNTIENDRLAAYDARDGLYRGETSFLDWREQTYPSWAANDVVHIGMSKTLSTNVNHWKILDVAAQMAIELGKPEASRYRLWADQLKQAINYHLWLEHAGMYSMGKLTELDPSAVERYELLGQALAILDGIADPTRVASILARYPHTAGGASVVWPQTREKPVYHNAAVWPFVSAYLIKAASLGANDAVVNSNLQAMIRGAALNLSHMENYRFINLDSQAPDTDSEAQLWSIAGYMNMVLDVAFGRKTSQTGIRFAPFITKLMRNKLFAGTSSLRLLNLPYQGAILNVTIELPATDGLLGGYYRVSGVMVNGVARSADKEITIADLAATNEIIVELVDANAGSASFTVLEDIGDWRRFWGPREPAADPSQGVTLTNGKLTLRWDAGGEDNTLFDIYRNGQLVASGVSGTSWLDPDSGHYATTALYYAVAQTYRGDFPVVNVSHHSRPVGYAEVETILASDPRISTNDGRQPISDHGRSCYAAWGYADQTMDIAYTPTLSGTYLFWLIYGNAFNSIGEGITNCVKLVEVFGGNNLLMTRGIVMLPHRASWDDWGESSSVAADFTAGKTYRIHLSDHYNMSYLVSYAAYNHAGGQAGTGEPCECRRRYSIRRMTTSA